MRPIEDRLDLPRRRSSLPIGVGPASLGRPSPLAEIPVATNSNKAQRGAYGRRLGERFGVDDAPYFVTRTLPRAELAVTEVRIDRSFCGLSDPIPYEDAFAISLILRDLPDNSYWEEGREVGQRTVHAGESLVHDLRRSPRVLVDKPLHSLFLYLPRCALDALADDANVPRIADLRYDPGVGVADETVKNLGLSLLPAIRAPDQVSRLFRDNLMLALGAHVAQAYGGMQAHSQPIRGGLAPWQEKRSKDMLAGDLTGATPLSEIAWACGLSVSHFSRAFRRSTGLAPHAWLLHTRIEAAKAMLRGREPSLSMVALACGFADQSHFTRVFTRRVGLSPGAWRKYLAE
ncbi:helix-turn-helix transcriptional regulator [Phenylobacterium sp.]|jgi:AraC-like DNA-binding protein|uniref:helix-turn-helix transcriptional regulator n=1 Tax=Phenylobacterium sp. TaxID=1871053 RepID=UPI002E34E821|nr:helix-turn-helix transcriptional regulator [Phenylobacterium sp.]HEX3364168.1 helix-turn-helix transcriptional regulator [Phenylobacterium sp.]